jgi:hypothetical protein
MGEFGPWDAEGFFHISPALHILTGAYPANGHQLGLLASNFETTGTVSISSSTIPISISAWRGNSVLVDLLLQSCTALPSDQDTRTSSATAASSTGNLASRSSDKCASSVVGRTSLAVSLHATPHSQFFRELQRKDNNTKQTQYKLLLRFSHTKQEVMINKSNHSKSHTAKARAAATTPTHACTTHGATRHLTQRSP